MITITRTGPRSARLRFGGRTSGGALLLAGPTVLAFFTGGYFAPARTWGGLVAWALVAFAVLLKPRSAEASDAPLVSRWLAPVALALLAAWTLASIAWAPIAGDAYGAGQIVVLYLGAVVAAVLLLDRRGAGSVLEPSLAAGTAIVVGYGLSARLLPGVLHFSRSVSAQGRLEQPLTYWNAMGELAAIGFVLCARIAGDARRPRWMRALAAATASPLGVGLYVSFSRGALFACLAGLLALLVCAPRRGQWYAILISLGAGIVAAAGISPLASVTGLSGRLGTREGQGAIALAVLIVCAVAAAVIQLRLSASRNGDTRVRLPRRAPWIATGVLCAGLAAAIAVGAKEQSGVPISGGANRLVTLQSNRYAYWKVALKAFDHDPLIGVGAGGWAVWWLRDRPYADGAQDAHSLELQTLAELGLVGAGLLLMFFVGIGLAARRAYLLDPLAAAGPLAGVLTWVAHSPLDWDWQMPAVTLVAMILVGGLLAVAGEANHAV